MMTPVMFVFISGIFMTAGVFLGVYVALPCLALIVVGLLMLGISYAVIDEKVEEYQRAERGLRQKIELIESTKTCSCQDCIDMIYAALESKDPERP